MTDRELLLERLERLAIVLDELMPQCAELVRDAITMLKEQEEEQKRIVNWLGRFCSHVEQHFKPLPDEQNIEFFRQKMKQQFGWKVK